MADQAGPIPVAQPVLAAEEAEAAARAVLSGWVTQGPEVQAFEDEFAALVGAPHASAVSSCTTALHLALMAVGVGPGDEVATVSHTFIATANAVRHAGAEPVFVDIESGTYNIDPQRLEAAIGPRCRAILCVHQMGMPCDLDRVLAVAAAHDLPVIEDSACAVGSEIACNGAWEPIGRPRGAVACFSFHPRKVITTGDGGMLTTADPELDQRFRLWRHHGMSVPDIARHQSRKVIFESYPVLGYNYRMTDIQAAVGREQLRRLPEIVARRRVLAERYLALLADVDGLGLPEQPPFARSNWQSFCVLLPEGLDQHATMQAMLDRGVATRRGIMCCHREAPYRDVRRAGPLGRSEEAQDRGVILPLYAQMTEDQQDRVISALKEALAA